jgi:cell wall-associated NlpC family hydrolase
MPLRVPTTLLACLLLAALASLLPATATAAAKKKNDTRAATGGTDPGDPRFAPGKKAKLINGTAVPPRGAPAEVVAAIEAGNRIIRKPYKYGGGHGRVEDSGYDCSGSVSYALYHAGLLKSPLDSSSFMRWGKAGKGKWMTIYTNPGHAYIVIAGLRLDTGYRGEEPRGTAPGRGPRWLKPRSPDGFVARHPAGL